VHRRAAAAKRGATPPEFPWPSALGQSSSATRHLRQVCRRLRAAARRRPCPPCSTLAVSPRPEQGRGSSPSLELQASIPALRQQIDRSTTARALSRRAELALRDRRAKARSTSGVCTCATRRACLDRLARANRVRSPAPLVRAIFLEIIARPSRSLEQRSASRIPGGPATFTHSRGPPQFGAGRRPTSPPPRSRDVFHEVEASARDLGRVPVDNSSEGMWRHTLDLLADSSRADLRRNRSLLPVRPNLLARRHETFVVSADRRPPLGRWRRWRRCSRNTCPPSPTRRRNRATALAGRAGARRGRGLAAIAGRGRGGEPLPAVSHPSLTDEPATCTRIRGARRRKTNRGGRPTGGRQDLAPVRRADEVVILGACSRPSRGTAIDLIKIVVAAALAAAMELRVLPRI